MSDTGPTSARRSTTRFILAPLVGVTLMTLFHLVDTVMTGIAEDGNGEVVLATIFLSLMFGFQVYFVWRIGTEWSRMPTRERWKVGLAAFVVPPLAALLIPVAIGLVIVIWAFRFWLDSQPLTAGEARRFIRRHGRDD